MRRLGSSRWPLLLLACIYLAWGLLYIQRTSFVVDQERVYSLWDDAMISMRYGRNLAEGRGLSWNGDDERVLGVTNLGLTLGMAALHLTSLSIPVLPLAVQLANLGALLAILAVSFRLARHAFGSDSPVPIVSAAIVASCAPLAIWGLQGSDVAAQCLVILLALDAIVARAVQARPWPLAALYLLAAGVWIRPDGTVALIAVVLTGCILAPNRGRVAIHGAVAAVLAWAPLLALGLLYYGDPLPNTYYLKVTGSPRELVWSSGLHQAMWLVRDALPLTLLCVVGGPLLLGRKPWFWVLAAVIAGQLAYHVEVGGDWQVDYVSRYLVPVLPVAAVLFTGIAWLLACRLRRWLPRIAAWALFASLALVGALALSPVTPRQEWLSPGQPTMLWKFNRLLYYYGEYFRDHTASDTLIAHHWAGIAPYVADRPALDLLGRSDRHIARLDVPRFAPGHSKWDWDYVIDERRPDIIIGADRGLEVHPGFLSLYQRAKTANNLVFYLREGSRAKVDDPALIYPYERDGSQ